MPFEAPASQKDQTLPMVITLRGDEAIVDEFTYDSDQAMTFLGIKRSRLNQISGRELRVARVRRDRYIRPVYREADLKDYLDWTRATATHLSSSKAIEQAVENLDDRFNDVLQVFNQKLDQVSEDQKGFLRAELERLPNRLPASEAREEREAEQGSTLLVDKVLRKHSARLGEILSGIELTSEKIELIRAALQHFIPELREINIGQKSLRLDLDQKFAHLSSALLELTALFGSFQASQGETAQRLQASIEDLAEEEAFASVAKPRIQRKRKIRGYFR